MEFLNEHDLFQFAKYTKLSNRAYTTIIPQLVEVHIISCSTGGHVHVDLSNLATKNPVVLFSSGLALKHKEAIVE